MKNYRHVQVSWLILFIFISILLLLTTLILTNEIRWVVLTPFLLAAFVLINFLWQTIEVDRKAVKVRFGPSLIRFTFPLQEIENVCIAESSWAEFWGARFTAKGLLVNIYSLNAVELYLKDGNLVRVGTNEPEKLAKAIEDQLIARKKQEHQQVP